MVRFQDLLRVPVLENGDSFTKLTTIKSRYSPLLDDMRSITGKTIITRAHVAKRLEAAQRLLKNVNSDYELFVTYGYRCTEVQIEYFLRELNQTQKFFEDPLDLYEEIFRKIAVPTVAGHPTGGAIDITIIDNATKQSLDFGSDLYDFKTKNCYTFSPYISHAGKANRMLLRSCLMDVGFAPFNGEWWHFSYGDKEWAYYYKKPNAIYGQKERDAIGT